MTSENVGPTGVASADAQTSQPQTAIRLPTMADVIRDLADFHEEQIQKRVEEMSRDPRFRPSQM